MAHNNRQLSASEKKKRKNSYLSIIEDEILFVYSLDHYLVEVSDTDLYLFA